jgi:hypothetical protein
MRAAAMALALLVPASALAQTPDPSVLLLGSSSTCGPFGVRVRDELRALGHTTRSYCQASSGLARPDAYDWMEHLPSSVGGASVIVFLGGNDMQGLRVRRRGSWSWIRWREEAEWRELYAERTRALIDALCDRGAARVVMVGPPPVLRERFESRLPRVREAMADGTSRSRCGVFLDTSGLVLDPETAYTRDDVHLSRSGAEIAWSALGDRFLAALAP